MGTPVFPKFDTVIHKRIFVKNSFIQQPSKMTMEPSQCVFFCNANGTNNYIKSLKGQHS